MYRSRIFSSIRCSAHPVVSVNCIPASRTFAEKPDGGVQGSGLRANGIRPPKVEALWDRREFRKVPMERLMSRLDLTKYNKEAPLDESEVAVKKVRIC